MANIKKQFLRNVGSGWLAVLVTGLVGFVMLPMNLKYLGKDLYGISALAVSTLTLFSFLRMGMQPALLRFFSHAVAAKNQDDFRALSSVSQLLLGGLGFIGAIGFVCTYPWFVSIYNVPDEVRSHLFILFLAIALNFLSGLYLIPYSTAIQAGNRFDANNTRLCLSQILRLIVLFIGYTFFTPSLLILAASTFAGTLYQQTSLTILAWKIHGSSIFFRWKSLRWNLLPPLFSFSVLILIHEVFLGLSTQLPILIIGKTLGVDMVSAFVPAITLSTFCSSILIQVSAPLVPVASKDIAENGGKNIGRWAIQMGEIVACVGCSIVVVFALLGGEIITIWLGESFAWTGTIVTVTIMGFTLASTQGANWRLALGGNTSIAPISLSYPFLAFVVSLGTFWWTVYGGGTLLGVAVFISLARLVNSTIYHNIVFSWQLDYRFVDYTLHVYIKPLLLGLSIVGIFFALKRMMPFSVENISILILFTLLVVGVYSSLCWKFVLQKNTRNSMLQLIKGRFNRINHQSKIT